MSSRPRAPRRDTVRRTSPVLGAVRARLESTREQLLTELDDVDAQLAALSARRHRLADRLAELCEDLWPAALHPRGRRPAETGESELPPLPEQPIWLAGRRLRSVCLALLRNAGRLTLVRLHALLHTYGYGVDNAHAAKALSDALAYEVECGRARRVRRGEYECAGPPPRPGRHGATPDRLLDPVLSPTAVAAPGSVGDRCS